MSKVMWRNHRRLKGAASSSEAVNQSINDAAYAANGWMEQTAAKASKMQEVIAAMIDLMPEDKQVELVNEVAYGWTRKE
jgi:hypothetical protein